MKHLGDITQINGYTATSVNVIIGGSPCQDLSVAGKRAGFRLDDFDCFLQDCSEVCTLVRTESSWDVFPHHVSWSDVSTCSSLTFIIFPHFFYNSYLFHKQPRTFALQARSLACYG